QKPFIEINAQWYQDAAAARAKVAPMAAGGGGGAAPATAPAAERGEEAPAAAPAAAAAAAPAAKSAAPVAPARPSREELGGYKYGENGVEGKCAVCGQYVVKGGVKFRSKSVLCPEDADKMGRLERTFGLPAGQR
ncbi:MAG: hypothetical protein K1X87_05225, partial [Dehalococcoidia bacterium]|nr:hypothetical protein [Dehalococcoidia bacterium]